MYPYGIVSYKNIIKMLQHEGYYVFYRFKSKYLKNNNDILYYI